MFLKDVSGYHVLMFFFLITMMYSYRSTFNNKFHYYTLEALFKTKMFIVLNSTYRTYSDDNDCTEKEN